MVQGDRDANRTCGICAGSILLLRELDRQAQQVGGAVFMLNGNHESLNIAGNFRRAHPRSMCSPGICSTILCMH